MIERAAAGILVGGEFARVDQIAVVIVQRAAAGDKSIRKGSLKEEILQIRCAVQLYFAAVAVRLFAVYPHGFGEISSLKPGPAEADDESRRQQRQNQKGIDELFGDVFVSDQEILLDGGGLRREALDSLLHVGGNLGCDILRVQLSCDFPHEHGDRCDENAFAFFEEKHER